MTIADDSWQHPDPRRSGVALVRVPEPVLHALARGEDPRSPEHPVTPYLAGVECAGLWRRRSRQLLESPADAPWVTRFVVVAGVDAPVGLAGFHGPPDERGMVEVGYRIDPAQRRRGYATQSLETLLAVARTHPDVHVVRATITPVNNASRSLVERYGFDEVGEQWDDEDGQELVYEVAAGGRAERAATGSAVRRAGQVVADVASAIGRAMPGA
ncbi:GNAT family N-acetyltransferase [Jatrophihabitans endophyticus]|uniref:GNAT family N-acetyltransferase n=1 Tax=Jatrophihabitans endophyticus TaxID=1206085 RepID=UPI00093337F5|nr:GNAT family N-acetyltransferase [Jatrophihabitans endophyticus]